MIPSLPNARRARNQTELKHQQDELGLYFWKHIREDESVILLSSHVTAETPHWCRECRVASEFPCERCTQAPQVGQLSLPGLEMVA